MVRYVHHQLITLAECAVAMAVTVPVVFALREVRMPEADVWRAVLAIVAVLVLFQLLFSTVGRLGGTKREFETALPLKDPDAVLPTPREPLRRSFGWFFVAVLVAVCLFMALMWEPLIAFGPLLCLPEAIVKGACAARWERRHGLVLTAGGPVAAAVSARRVM